MMKTATNNVNKDGFILLERDVNDQYGALPYGSGLTTKHASPDKVYMQHLARCKTYSTAKEIYPGISNPIKDDLRSLYDLGLVARYTKPQYLKTKEWYGESLTYATRIWWKATPKGIRLLNKIGM